jgi:exodeoxyribonuclease III
MTKIITWNVNGLKRAMENGFPTLIDEENPDIICLQETKTNEENMAKLLESFAGKYHFECSSSIKENNFPYSGVATLSRIKPSRITKTFGSSQFDKEGRIMISEYPLFVLYNCYFPTGASGKKYQDMKRAFYNECTESIKNTLASGKEVVLCGDFNTARDERDVVDVLRKKVGPGFLPEDREDIEKLFSLGMVDAFRINVEDGGHYTWWGNTDFKTKDWGWRIDYFLMSPGLKGQVQTCSHRSEFVKNDHCPIILYLKDGDSGNGTNQLQKKNIRPGQSRFCAEIVIIN